MVHGCIIVRVLFSSKKHAFMWYRPSSCRIQ